jgi:hypothetical protein
MAKQETTTKGEERPANGGRDELAIILDHTRETLELVRSLVALLLQKQGDDGRPRLEDLIAALVAQQRTILVCIRQIQADIDALHVRLRHPEGSSVNRHDRANAGLPS